MVESLEASQQGRRSDAWVQSDSSHLEAVGSPQGGSGGEGAGSRCALGEGQWQGQVTKAALQQEESVRAPHCSPSGRPGDGGAAP